MAKCMPKDPGDDAATKQRKENNYRAKKHNKNPDTNEPRRLASLDADLPTHPVPDTQEPTRDCTPPRDVQKPGLKPFPTPLDASIPFKTQFGILTTVQGWLEKAIFDFFRKWLPEVLEAKDIDVAEKVELTDWADTIGKEIKALPKAATDRIPGTSLMQELRATYQLRNAALKRQQLSSTRLLELLGAASNLVTIMKDERKISLIGALMGEIEAGSRVLETRIEATKKAILQDSDIIEGMKKVLTEQLTKATKAASARCERNRKGVGITLDLFLDNTRKGSTSGGQMAIFEDELLQLQESQETFLPQGFHSQYANLFQTDSLQIGGSAMLSVEDGEKGRVKGGQEGSEKDAKENGRKAVAISSNTLNHAVDGNAQVQGASTADASSAGTSSAFKVPGHTKDGLGNFKDHSKAILPLAEKVTTNPNSSASLVQSGINKKAPFMASHSKAGNADKNQLVDVVDSVGDADFNLKEGPQKSTANAVSGLPTDIFTMRKPISRKGPRLWAYQPSTDAVPAPSLTQPLFGQENGQARNPTSSKPSVANTSAGAVGTSPPLGTQPIKPTEKADPIKQDQKPGSGLLPSLFATAQSNPASGATTSFKEKQAAVTPSATSQPPDSDTTQSNTSFNNSSQPSSTLLPQTLSSFPSSTLGASPLDPVNTARAPANPFKFTKPTISQISRCFGTTSLPFNALYFSEREARSDGEARDLMLSAQSITFMMGHRNYSFEELRLADYQRGWGQKVQKVQEPAAKKEVPGAFPSSPEKASKGSEGDSQ
ncbi:MAG: hypothetical protein HETSPECPRED_004521 [Heterodermia speciosa]|uniref:Uncharacterized protein n=1 Tax=Heterodermia speciosa TaxID=116794 RepID=A0A8H3IN77_9LECA|nr:MAG: hypothetical protein HETSPECPRED_004521 [Heterodermia speciosa]